MIAVIVNLHIRKPPASNSLPSYIQLTVSALTVCVLSYREVFADDEKRTIMDIARATMMRLMSLITPPDGTNPTSPAHDKSCYGLGTARKFQEWTDYCGVDVHRRRISQPAVLGGQRQTAYSMYGHKKGMSFIGEYGRLRKP